ncbi:MAG TPA: cytochrome o ubiquinol oxidase subunit IV [Candidatus Sulfotelmatobacter sp.]|nr:cytochrome o ubiquinol oxidase subunit IV [Candidatus Sulfotelmatobacter sp.]
MSKEKPVAVVSKHSTEYGTLRTYFTGYILSIILTLGAYLLVVNRHTIERSVVLILIVAFALIQFLVQLYYFLHLGKETKPRWKLFVFGFMVSVVLILVFGSIWIMNHLNTRMTPAQVNTYLSNQGGGF